MNELISNDALAAAAQFFLWAMLEISLLFLVVSFVVESLQQSFSKVHLKRLLSGPNAYFFAVGLGALTPFCSCSTLPLMIGLIKAQARFGAVMAFLLTSPLLNPFVVTLFWVSFGHEVTLVYMAFILVLAPLSGYLLQKLSFQRYIRSGVYAEQVCENADKNSRVWQWRHSLAKVWKDFVTFLPYLMFGVGIGAMIHGFIPESLFIKYASAEPWWLIPIAAVVGVFLYIRASTMVPIASALIAKGISIGAVMSLAVAGAGASLPEMIMMKRIFHWPLLIAFLLIVFVTACATGAALNLLV